MLRSHARWLGILALTSVVAACSDDSTSTGGSDTGAGGSGGSGGDPQGGAPQGGAPQGGAPQGGAPQGGAPQGGEGGVGGDGGAGANGGAGGSGGGALGPNGALCDGDGDCLGGLCLPEADTGLPGGMCTEDCTTTATCAAGSTCIQLTEDGSFAVCLRDCDPMTAGSCGDPATLECLDVDTPAGGVCFPACGGDADCTVAGNVCQPDEYCAPPEDCGNTTDDDLDGDIDCVDTDCATDPVCSAVCMTAIAAMAVNDGDTSAGTTQFDSECVGAPGGGEVLYTYTAAATGSLDLTLESATDQGISVRTTCLNPQSELGCSDAFAGGTDETLSVGVQMGQQVFIIVDAWEPGEEGPFTLLVDFVAGTPEAVCDGGSTNGQCGGGESCLCSDCWLEDGCQASCVADGMCTTDDDCVCDDCDMDAFCSDAGNCVNDGTCDAFNEGCVCADCAPNPACTGVPLEPECAGATPNGMCTAGEPCTCSDCTMTPACMVADPQCTGGITNSVCEAGEGCFCADCAADASCQSTCVAGGGCTATEDCVCADCDADAFCVDTDNCSDDGFCNPFLEGCLCADCVTNPACTDNYPTCAGGMADGTCAAGEPCTCGDCFSAPACNTDPTCIGNVANGMCQAGEPCSCADCAATPQCTSDPDCAGGVPNGTCAMGESCLCIDCEQTAGCQADCNPNGMCGFDDDCVCDDCDTDAFCSDPMNCTNNGVCDPFNEGCICADCATNPACL